MIRLSRFVAQATVALVLALSPVAAYARDLTAAESDALDQTLARFNAAMSAGDMVAMTKALPPPVLTHIAEKSGITEEQLLAAMMEQVQEAMKQVKIDGFSMDLDAAEHRELADGTPYLVIPTHTQMDLGEQGKIAADSPTLAMLDDGNWYLMRVSDPEQLEILRTVYPEFAGVEFPPGKMEQVAQ